MANNALEKLKLLFHNQPDVLRMLDWRELDLAGLESEAFINEQKKRELFPEPVNLYVTGRTGSGKTSLGNSLLDSGKKPMEAHGHIDCTKYVQYFALKSNLRYFDLPGAGSNEQFENVNRAALMVEQIEEEEDNISPIAQFKLIDFSKYSSGEIKEKDITVEQWQSKENQTSVSPDIILYVVAPHMQFIRDDKRYLRALLKSLKQHSSSNKVIFALNIHRQDGAQVPTPQNIEDARKGITEIYQKFYNEETPIIVEIDSLKGSGLNQITDFMCRILPSNKIGNLQQVLRGELKERAKKERSRRYRQALIYIASRLATYPVDVRIGKGIVEEAYAAICDYAIKIFRVEDAVLEFSRDLYKIVDNYAAQAKMSREEAIKVIVSEVVEKDVIESVIVGFRPGDVDVPGEPQKPNTHPSQTNHILKFAAAGGLSAFAGAAATLVASGAAITTAGLAIPLIAAVAGGAAGAAKAMQNQIKPDESVVENLKSAEQRLVGMIPERQNVTRKVKDIVQKEQEVGKKYLQGGYPVVENLLAIGLGIENDQPPQDLETHFEDIVQTGKDEVQAMISPYKEEINKLAESSTTPEKAQQAEKQIITILEQALIKD